MKQLTVNELFYTMLLYQDRLDGDESVTCGGMEAIGVWSATSPLCHGNAYLDDLIVIF